MTMKANGFFPLSLAAAAVFLAACAGTPESDADMAATGAAEPYTSGSAEQIGVDRPFSEMDANNDGSLSREEVAVDEMLSQHFAQADTDRNGLLSQAEVDAHRAEMSGPE